LQTDSDFAGLIVVELNASLLKDLLYLEDGGEVSFHYSFILLDPLEGRQPDPGSAGKLALAPATTGPFCCVPADAAARPNIPSRRIHRSRTASDRRGTLTSSTIASPTNKDADA
jgi:hypothetical protein